MLGFLLVSFYQSDLHRLLDGTVGDNCDLLLMSPYWRAVYCSKPALAAPLAEDLRRRLLDGEPLSGAGEEFSYPALQDKTTGLYVVLRQPQVFDRGTIHILYTISLSSALVCLALAVAMSFTLSRQLFHPIERLHRPSARWSTTIWMSMFPMSATTSWDSWRSGLMGCWWR